MNFKLYIANLPFMFLNGQDLLDFLGRLFLNSIAKDKLYENLIEWNTTLLYRSCFSDGMAEEQQIKIFNTLELLEESYGRIYDPEKVFFSSCNKIKYN